VRVRVRAAIAAIATAVAIAGCGFGPGLGPGTVSLRVTRDFGSTSLETVGEGKVPGQQTDMQLLQHHFTVQTRYGGGFVQSIDGHSGTSHHYDWFFYVNGVQAKKGAAALNVKTGDHIWFDLHDWQATNSIPAVVGSFPEPFLHGINGQRYPTTLECGAHVKESCNVVSSEFSRFKIPASPQVIGTGSGPDTLSINVGLWSTLAPEVAGALIDKGPGASGVYAHFSADGSKLLLENPAGKVVKTLGPGAGLIAATGDPTDVPTWLVGGTDEAGVMAAAHALTPAALAGHFALAVQGGKTYPLPLVGH
jgi:Domain of unknown function (DUF4430)